jgi:hypothetical protein
LELATYVLEEQSRKELEIVQLSSNNVRRRSQELSADVVKQLVSLLQYSVAFSPQLDELTIVSWLAVSPVFVRCFFENKQSKTECLNIAVFDLQPFPVPYLH